MKRSPLYSALSLLLSILLLLSACATNGNPAAENDAPAQTGAAPPSQPAELPEPTELTPAVTETTPQITPEITPETTAEIPISTPEPAEPPVEIPVSVDISAIEPYILRWQFERDDATLPQECLQLVIVDEGADGLTVRFFERTDNVWTENSAYASAAYPGKNGVSYTKIEGDGVTPAGLFAIGDAFYIETEPATGLDTFRINSGTYWVDDPGSKFYNQRVEGTAEKDWKSAEEMYKYKKQYNYGFVIEYNPEREPGSGSAIFFHVGTGSTSGCVATSESSVLKYLAVLDKAKAPHILILPQGEAELPSVITPAQNDVSLPKGFSYVRDINAGIRVELRYATTHNFTGSIVEGYRSADRAILRTEAAAALGKVQDYLAEQGYGLLIYDAYRPTKAVDFFYNWSQNGDDSTKEEFFPNHNKTELFGLGYIASRSRHSHGVAVDLTVVDNETGQPIDMGGNFDLFDDRSHHDFSGVTAEQAANRKLLKDAMAKFGFGAFSEEWWHYNYSMNEGNAYNFDVE